MKSKTLKILKDNNNDFISGEKISNEIGMTRAGVWKHIEALREEGYDIETARGKGYKLLASADILSYEEIEPYLNTKFIGRRIIHFHSIDSTNKEAKGLASSLEEGSVLIGEEQSSGRGRLGREWISPRGKGIWMSIVLKPELEPERLSRITLIGAVSIFKALENIGIVSEIKWPNDILISKKKVGGILTEMSGELNMIHHLVMGLGINVNLDKDDIPEDLRHKASSLKIEENKKINRQRLTGDILNEFEKYYIEFKKDGSLDGVIEILRSNSALIGKEVRVISGKRERLGLARDINDRGQLLVEFEEGIESIDSGEVSIRARNGYT